jgi:hypothetical protein
MVLNPGGPMESPVELIKITDTPPPEDPDLIGLGVSLGPCVFIKLLKSF